MLSWNLDQLLITHQTKVQFLLGKLSFQVWCDVLPIHTVSCHMLLGRPWCKEHGAAYCMDNYRYTKYVVPYGRQTYTLLSMDTIKYKTWRDEKLEQLQEDEDNERQHCEAKIKVQGGATEKEPEDVTLFSVHVQSTTAHPEAAVKQVAFISLAEQVLAVDPIFDDPMAAEDDSKPRTVSPKEGEDDAAPPIFAAGQNTVLQVVYALNNFQFKQNDKRQISTLSKPKSDEHAYEWVQSSMDVRVFLVDQWEKEFGYTTYMANNKASEVLHRDCLCVRECSNISTYYYFGSPRPPDETVQIVKALGCWDRLNLNATGWGPPACIGQHKQSSYFVPSVFIISL
jgi:hypothetical protein